MDRPFLPLPHSLKVRCYFADFKKNIRDVIPTGPVRMKCERKTGGDRAGATGAGSEPVLERADKGEAFLIARIGLADGGFQRGQGRPQERVGGQFGGQS